MDSPKSVALLFLVLLLGVAAYTYIPQENFQQAKASQLANVLSGTLAPPLDARTKTEGCIVVDNSPDHACTPGAVFDTPLSTICVSGYSARVRNVSESLRKAVFAEYGIAYPVPHGAYEVDHLIPLAIGGDNDIANLFPQPAAPTPGFKEKDLVEVYLQEQVCAGNVNLAVAQQKIAVDWLSIYNNLAPTDITRIKAKYKNWAN